MKKSSFFLTAKILKGSRIMPPATFEADNARIFSPIKLFILKFQHFTLSG